MQPSFTTAVPKPTHITHNIAKEESKRNFDDTNSHTFIGKDDASSGMMAFGHDTGAPQQVFHRPLADMMSLSDMSHLNQVTEKSLATP